MKKTMTVIMADLHLGKFWKSNNAAFSRAKKMINNFLYNFDNTIIEPLSNNNDTVINLIIAGDVYDSVHNNIELLCFVKEELSKRLRFITERNGKVFIIAGNHEIFIDKNSNQQSMLTIGLDSYNNKIISNEIYNYQSINENKNYILIPFHNDIESIFKEQVPEYLSKEYDNIIIAHTTPKEIFYQSKYSINEYIDQWKEDKNINIPYIILGHYHKPYSYNYNNTDIISIGNSYYNTLDDLRDYNKELLKKRFVTLLDNQIIQILYTLPEVHEYNIKNQSEFDNMDFSNINKENDIVYIKSKELIDYSQLMFEGYDVYFDLQENTDDNINNIQQSLSEAVNDTVSGKTLDERWNTYINYNRDLNEREKIIATLLFNKRNDMDINSKNVFDMFNDNNERDEVNE